MATVLVGATLAALSTISFGASLTKFQCPDEELKGYVTYPVHGDSRAYWKCLNHGDPIMEHCSHKKVYSRDYGECLPKGYDKFKCPESSDGKKDSTHPANWDPQAYWLCGEHGPRLKYCDLEKVYGDKERKCVRTQALI